jgi:hypothetical protein
MVSVALPNFEELLLKKSFSKAYWGKFCNSQKLHKESFFLLQTYFFCNKSSFGGSWGQSRSRRRRHIVSIAELHRLHIMVSRFLVNKKYFEWNYTWNVFIFM